jgi:hypothetical protein
MIIVKNVFDNEVYNNKRIIKRDNSEKSPNIKYLKII